MKESIETSEVTIVSIDSDSHVGDKSEDCMKGDVNKNDISALEWEELTEFLYSRGTRTISSYC